ncbi:hypothetical protein BU24DRAFT_156661 [Aaosphaeria arxii CBS 175.79]|uniref:Uncharacterized protein n=1 Tax=Aaosphaeria arxii CBS 175.79 TaxID=1450172 RepID=A0A6A5XXZ9_9PLEO|nr:uncharacterized protein BU24DRAFT_156661 [Aaosphaeria arxii CBS 175.79]KAF2017707.1 hypothetical protein BU24DRAFT_156661 [Aaosphaeria arxii CBS 175.79]
MRFEDWDIILFPQDSHIPIQEFNTASFITNSSSNHHLHIVTCYIASLLPSSPFRISLHSWARQPKPSDITGSKRKRQHQTLYEIRVIIDGIEVSQSLHEPTSRWPVEIGVGGLPLTPSIHSRQISHGLRFPSFQSDILTQTSWDPANDRGRIKVLILEQPVDGTSSLGTRKLRSANELVCFSFQHAPRDVLERAGIAYPIRNPLYSAPGSPRQDSSVVTTGRPSSQIPTSTMCLPSILLPGPDDHAKYAARHGGHQSNSVIGDLLLEKGLGRVTRILPQGHIAKGPSVGTWSAPRYNLSTLTKPFTAARSLPSPIQSIAQPDRIGKRKKDISQNQNTGQKKQAVNVARQQTISDCNGSIRSNKDDVAQALMSAHTPEIIPFDSTTGYRHHGNNPLGSGPEGQNAVLPSGAGEIGQHRDNSHMSSMSKTTDGISALDVDTTSAVDGHRSPAHIDSPNGTESVETRLFTALGEVMGHELNLLPANRNRIAYGIDDIENQPRDKLGCERFTSPSKEEENSPTLKVLQYGQSNRHSQGPHLRG